MVAGAHAPRRRTPDRGSPEQVFVVHLPLVAHETVDARQHRQRGRGNARRTATVVPVADDHHAAALGLDGPRQVAVKAAGDLRVLVTAGAGANDAAAEAQPGRAVGQQGAGGGRGDDGHRRGRRLGQREERQNRFQVWDRFVVSGGRCGSRGGPGAVPVVALDAVGVAETVAFRQRRRQYELRTIKREKRRR